MKSHGVLDKELSYRRETARRLVSLNILICHLRPVYSDATQLNSTSSCVAIDAVTDATQLSLTIELS